MKHIFTVHSPLTFLVAYSIVEHLSLDETKVVFICSNYKPPIDKFRCIPSFVAQNQGFFRKIKTLNVPYHYDCYINDIIEGESFTAYIDLMSYYQKILVTHTKCKVFHFYEEGNSAYQEFDDLDDITWHERVLSFRTIQINLRSLIRVLRGFNLRLLAMPYNYSAYLNVKGLQFYALSSNAFYNIPTARRVLLNPKPDQADIKQMAGNYMLENAVVWIDGSNSRYTGLTEDFYHNAIHKAVDLYKNHGVIENKVYVKLRPGAKHIESNALVRILKKYDIDVEVLPDAMIIEAFFLISKNCKVIGTLTSVLEYAHVFGHEAYSIYPYFEKQPTTFFDRMTGFWKNIQTI